MSEGPLRSRGAMVGLVPGWQKQAQHMGGSLRSPERGEGRRRSGSAYVTLAQFLAGHSLDKRRKHCKTMTVDF